MNHSIDLTQGPPTLPEMAEAISNCVHCGFCLPVCPTYQVQAEEMDSPRGRIFLMKESLEGSLPLAEAMPYIDNCLGCMACVTACPSGVKYGELLSPFRALGEETNSRRTFGQLLRRALALRTLPFPRRLRAALAIGASTRFLHGLVPAALAPLTQLIPDRIPKPVDLSTFNSIDSPKVGVLAGCAQSVLAPEVNQATARVLRAFNVSFAFLNSHVCCGALHMHAGEAPQARVLAQGLLEAVPADIEVIISNAAGCGSGMHEYPLLFKDLPQEEKAERVAAQTMDISVFLSRLPKPKALKLDQPLRVGYHDACHLQHAQGVTVEPRELLSQIDGLELVELTDAEFCCGSAGIYNIEHPETADQLGQLKAEAVMAKDLDLLVTGNIGCMFQIRSHLRRRHSDIPIQHTMQIIDAALSQTRKS